MQIKNIILKNPVIIAPMAGITDRTFRDINKDFGCSLAYTEMISAKALTYKNTRTRAMIDTDGEPGPVSVQIFGSEPEVMAEAARLVELTGADIIDINMGCPVPKVVKNKEGSALMQDLSLSARIIKTVVNAVSIPVTVKIRKGWDENNINAIEFARMAEANGVAAIAVHGRTRAQFYTGEADWDIIRQVAENVRLPVIGNGDIWQPQDAQKMIDLTGCQGVMIGRGSLGNPWLIKRTVRFLEDGILLPEPAPDERINMAVNHLNLLTTNKGEKIAVKEMRKHIAWYIKGIHGAARLREQVNKINSSEDLVLLLENYKKFITTEEVKTS